VIGTDVEETAAPALDEREALVQSIEEDKAELLDAVGELKTAVQHQFQLGEWIADNPVPWLLGSLLVGLWLSTRKRS
jgi:hypothetical protein